MSAAKHTPGPWFATPTKGDFGHVSSVENPDDGGGDIATTWGVKGDAADHARVIAAAPDMLTALRAMEEADNLQAISDALLLGRAAIAKAEGRSDA